MGSDDCSSATTFGTYNSVATNGSCSNTTMAGFAGCDWHQLNIEGHGFQWLHSRICGHNRVPQWLWGLSVGKCTWLRGGMIHWQHLVSSAPRRHSVGEKHDDKAQRSMWSSIDYMRTVAPLWAWVVGNTQATGDRCIIDPHVWAR